MEKCQKCKKRTPLIYCSYCSTNYCLECDRLFHTFASKDNHRRKNNTSNYLSLSYDGRSNFNLSGYKPSQKLTRNEECKFKGYISHNNFYKKSRKEDPNINLINKLEFILDNNLDCNVDHKNELLSGYKNDFNTMYSIIRKKNLKEKIDVNDLLKIIEEQDVIINNLFKKVYYLKQQIKQDIFFDKNNLEMKGRALNAVGNDTNSKNYFERKLDIINQIYEKEKEKLIEEQEKNILKIKNDYNLIKNKFLSLINFKENKSKPKDEIKKILTKIKSAQNKMNIKANKLSKLHDEINVAELCINDHINELIDKLGKIEEKSSSSKQKISRFNSFNGRNKSKLTKTNKSKKVNKVY